MRSLTELPKQQSPNQPHNSSTIECLYSLSAVSACVVLLLKDSKQLQALRLRDASS